MKFKMKNTLINKFLINTIFCLAISFFQSCTTIGFHNTSLRNSISFGEQTTLRYCVYFDPDLSESRIDSLLEDLQTEMNLYKIKIIVSERKKWKRPYFFTSDTLYSIMKENLGIHCDRIMGFVPRNFFDFLLAIPLPEILGVVETITHSRGFIYADYFTPNIILGTTPGRTLIHENYHLLGCNHALIMDECYTLIQELKKNKTGDFFPTYLYDKQLIESAEKADSIVKEYFKSYKSKEEK